MAEGRTLIDVLDELADPSTPVDRLAETEDELGIAVLKDRIPSDLATRLYCALARHPNLPAHRLAVMLTADGLGYGLDLAAIRSAAAENPSLPLYRLTGELPL